MKRLCRCSILIKLRQVKGLWFHFVGLVCLIWFSIRVLPAPHRSQYPCQQVVIPLALAYIAFWAGLFHTFRCLLKRSKHRITTMLPSFSIFILIVSSLSGMVFAYTNEPLNFVTTSWEPVSKNPIGDPKGFNPGRVVWIWNPDATSSELRGFWWYEDNTDRDVVEEMFSIGIRGISGAENDFNAWDRLFTYFNEIHGHGSRGYQPGEKIAIKVNLNNCWDYFNTPYITQDNERDASPVVVKTLLRQLTQVVGISQEDIILYDASRAMANWFYYRVYYQTFPAISPIAEFPDIHYIDMCGDALGRESVEPSTEKIYFADGTRLTRTLPTCIVDADYIINMPLLKRHPLHQGVTLAGKNFFGTWIEPVVNVHKYHESSQILGNSAPQTDLLAHDLIGGKTVLYIGDGLFPTLKDHREIGKFQMFPFNNDWTNSLFFSQDPVAIDSVMYDFLYTEGTNPTEGSQNYLHQAADPPSNIYDPENDGEYLSESLGVHEHWDTNYDIFSSERYSGPSHNGIDFLTFGKEYVFSGVKISSPAPNFLYINDNKIIPFPATCIIGKITVQAIILDIDGVEKVEFSVDDHVRYIDYEEPYEWIWETTEVFTHELVVTAYRDSEEIYQDTLLVWKFF